MVSIICTAYNHEQFIQDALEGMLNQKTNFTYEIIVHDDASTDGTKSIIEQYEKKYPEIIKPIYQTENQFRRCKIMPTFMFPKAIGKYIALCEGDDYWTDSNKLQKQIDFLEAHEDYSMCLHNAVKINCETGEKHLLNTFRETGTYDQREQILTGLGSEFPATASYVFRTNLLREIPEFFLKASVLDYPLRQYFASRGKVYYFEEAMSVYRVMTPTSRMRTFSKSQDAYNDYTIGMIRFYENLNEYTGRRYADILDCKIKSDYLGFCISCEKEIGMQKALDNGLDIQLITKCYSVLTNTYIEQPLAELRKKAKHIFIYGTSRLAALCKQQLDACEIDFEGFVVSDGQMKSDLWEEKSVYYLSDVKERYEKPGFILAVQPINILTIKKVLEQKGINNYCEPYIL